MGRIAHRLHVPRPFLHAVKVYRAELGKLFFRKQGTIWIIGIRAFGRRLYLRFTSRQIFRG